MMELSIGLKATVIVGAGLAAARMACRARASVRHVCIAATFAALALLPVAAAFIAPVSVEVPRLPAGLVSPPDLTTVAARASGRAAEIARTGSLAPSQTPRPPTAILLRAACSGGWGSACGSSPASVREAFRGSRATRWLVPSRGNAESTEPWTCSSMRTSPHRSHAACCVPW